VALAAAEKVGLVAPRKSGAGYYDRFRHRLMFAVIDVQGRVIAFSGRSLDEPPAERLRPLGLEPSTSEEPPAKYMNSPESAVYRKREAVFGLYQARQALRAIDRAVLVEGNFDVLSLHARGTKNVVAPLGTAFTIEQARTIRRFTTNVTLLFDPDEAGRRAVRAGRDVCREAGLVASVATLPAGMDPDELVRQEGAERLGHVIDAAQPILSYLMEERLDENFKRNDPATQARKIQEVIDLIKSEDDPTLRALAETHADELAARLNLGDGRTIATLKRSIASALAPERQTPAPGNRVEPPHRARSRDQREEFGRVILGAFLDFPELLDGPLAEQAALLLEGDFAIALAALRHFRQEGVRDPEVVLAKTAPPIHAFALARWAAPQHETLADAKAVLEPNLRKLLSLEWSREKATLFGSLERAEKAGEVDENTLRRSVEGARRRRGMS
jgi:DNA primase